MTKELVTKKKLLGIINEIISNEFAKIQKNCSVSVLRRKNSNPNWKFINFRYLVLI
ncbi:hypothetical protein NTGM5_730002 [Candidatus Nitrotoga sp. M5]|nr:hypothetical protein NTGM5_730002 [Candidatus Nitrotoga sp. M5]